MLTAWPRKQRKSNFTFSRAMYLVLHATRSLHEFEYWNMPDLDGNLTLNRSPSLARRRKRAACGSTKYRFLWRGLQPFRYLPYDINALSLSLCFPSESFPRLRFPLKSFSPLPSVRPPSDVVFARIMHGSYFVCPPLSQSPSLHFT